MRMNDMQHRIDGMKQSVVHYGKQMLQRGLVAGTWGNISVRDTDLGRIAITPSGRPYGEIQPDDIVLTDMTGHIVSGTRPSSELPLHLSIYAARPDVSAIVHSHSVFATGCAVAGTGIPPSLEEMVQAVGGGVAVAGYALPGTPELAENAVAALGNRMAVLLANHGAVACGETLKEAMLVAELVEKAAHVHVIAVQLGGACRLSDEDVLAMHRFYRESYRQP